MNIGDTTNHLMVVETYDGDAYLGRLRLLDGAVRVYTGYAGHPVTVPNEEVAKIILAAIHPDVELVA